MGPTFMANSSLGPILALGHRSRLSRDLGVVILPSCQEKTQGSVIKNSDGISDII